MTSVTTNFYIYFLSVKRKSSKYFFSNVHLFSVKMKSCFLFLVFLSCVGIFNCSSSLSVSSHDLSLLTKDNSSFTLYRSDDDESVKELWITFNLTHGNSDGLLQPLPNISLSPNSSQKIDVIPRKAGHVDIAAWPHIENNQNISFSEAFVRVVVIKSKSVDTLSTVIGWIYFVAWSISFYPQIIDNFRRKSVIGLNFDFVALNIVGFTLYGCYNVALFWIDSIQEEYMSRHPMGVIPVQANDVFFPLHAVWACAVTLVQCAIYERAGQTVSRLCLGILTGIGLFVVISLILTLTNVIVWLDFLMYCSYVKLGITLIKYVPQAVMNYRRKSTVGWSIGNILLDFTGGMLSMVQMFLIAYNNDDWSSLFGDPTKFGLGLFSVVFDIFFMLQHYVFYRGNLPHETLQGSNEELRTSPNTPGTPEMVHLG